MRLMVFDKCASLHLEREAATDPRGLLHLYAPLVILVVKRYRQRGQEPRVFFWRTAGGEEVDLLVEENGRLVPVEVKATATPRPGMPSGLQAFLRDYPHRADRGWLVHLGTHVLPLAPGVTAVPLEMV